MNLVSSIKENIKGYEGYYQIDIEGNVYSVERIVEVKMPYGIKLQRVVGIKRKLSEHESGYLTVRLAKEGTIKTHRVHVLVAETFITNSEEKPYVNHKDGNKHNNLVNNLEWVTAKENTDHYREMVGDKITNFNHPSSKFSEDIVRVWHSEIKQGKQIIDIAKEYNCDRNTVSRLVKRIKYE